MHLKDCQKLRHKIKTENHNVYFWTQVTFVNIVPYLYIIILLISMRLTQTPAKVNTQNSTQPLLLSTNYPHQHGVMYVHHYNAHFYPFPFMFKPL